MKRSIIVGILLLSAAAHAQQIAATQPISAAVDATKLGPPISKYLYGQFVEHLRSTINNGIWAEMLDDRKFYNTITSRVPPQAGRGRGGGGGGGFIARRWTPIGPDDSVVMDTVNPFVGVHSPMVKLDGSGSTVVHQGDQLTPQQMRDLARGEVSLSGIQQSGQVVVQGRSYTARVALSGDATAKVAVSLIWGNAPTDRQTEELSDLTPDYKTYQFSFTAGADAGNARFEIAGTGSGSFHIGVASLMPADNVHGFRREVVALLAQLHSGVYRFPGGNYISNYQWQDTVGPIDKRPPTWDYAWNAVQPNDVGIDEFMQLWQLLGVDPYFTVNAGFGDAYSAAQLVEYCNSDASTPMGKWRAANGHAEPYNIKLWGIGNEMYGDWQLGVMPLDQFEKKTNIFAAAMRHVDPSITLIASGAMPDEMTTTLQGKRLDGKVLTGILSKADWTGGMLSNCLPNIDMVSEHCYCTNGQGFDMAGGAYVPVDEPLVDWVRRPANRVQAKYEAYQEYLKRIPALAKKPVPISVDEYSYRGVRPASYKPALAIAYQFDEMFRHTDVFRMAAYTFATSCLNSSRADAVLNPVGMVFKLYRDHFGTIPVDVTGNSPQPPPKYPVGGDQPKVNAGTDTYPLDVSAALSDDHKTLTIAIVNPTESAQQLSLSVAGVEFTGTGHLWQLAPPSVNSANIVTQPPQVVVQDETITGPPASLALKPISVNIYEFDLK